MAEAEQPETADAAVPAGPTMLDPARVLGILARTHPDAVAAATWQAAYEDLATLRDTEQKLYREREAARREAGAGEPELDSTGG